MKINVSFDKVLILSSFLENAAWRLRKRQSPNPCLQPQKQQVCISSWCSHLRFRHFQICVSYGLNHSFLRKYLVEACRGAKVWVQTHIRPQESAEGQCESKVHERSPWHRWEGNLGWSRNHLYWLEPLRRQYSCRHNHENRSFRGLGRRARLNDRNPRCQTRNLSD